MIKRGIRWVCQRILTLAQEKPKGQASLSRKQITERLLAFDKVAREHAKDHELYAQRLAEVLTSISNSINTIQRDVRNLDQRIANRDFRDRGVDTGPGVGIYQQTQEQQLRAIGTSLAGSNGSSLVQSQVLNARHIGSDSVVNSGPVSDAREATPERAISESPARELSTR